MKFQGLYTAIVTPFVGNRVDEEAFRMLVEAQVAAGVAGIVAVGTTGESPTLTVKEHLRVIELAVESAAGRIQVVAGTGANSTAEAIHMTQEAEKMGVDGTLQVCPYYNKPSQDGVYAHFKAIADATRLPIMLYSIPGRCGIEISVETVGRLAKDCPHIICVKEAGGSVDRVKLASEVTILPQLLKNVRVADKAAALNDPDVQAAGKAVDEALGNDGRLLLRQSGTEPLIRVMVEAETPEICEKYVDQVIDVLKKKGHVTEG